MSQWCVLKCSGGTPLAGSGYLGQQWEPNGSGGLTRPRTALVDLQNATLYPSRSAAQDEAARAKQILGRGFSPVEVHFEGRGKESQVVVIKTAYVDFL